MIFMNRMLAFFAVAWLSLGAGGQVSAVHEVANLSLSLRAGGAVAQSGSLVSQWQADDEKEQSRFKRTFDGVLYSFNAAYSSSDTDVKSATLDDAYQNGFNLSYAARAPPFI
jgi:hypothetical protein